MSNINFFCHFHHTRLRKIKRNHRNQDSHPAAPLPTSGHSTQQPQESELLTVTLERSGSSNQTSQSSDTAHAYPYQHNRSREQSKNMKKIHRNQDDRQHTLLPNSLHRAQQSQESQALTDTSEMSGSSNHSNQSSDSYHSMTED